MSRCLLNYTREPIDNILYDPKLAYSMHLALQREDGSFMPLNHNSGVLFAKAVENQDGSLDAKSLKNPYLFEKGNGCYGIAAVRIPGDGGQDEKSKGSVLIFTTEDLTAYREWGLLRLDENYIEKVFCRHDAEKGVDTLVWRNEAGQWRVGESKDVTTLTLQDGARDVKENELPAWVLDAAEGAQTASTHGVCTHGICTHEICGDIEGAVPHNTIEIPDAVAELLEKRLLTPKNETITVPETVTAGSAQELQKALEACRATAHYSDGSETEKRVDWEVPEDIDFSKPGTHRIRGTVHREHFAFPVAYNRADPCVAKWGEKYYFIATNDADSNHTLYIREADTIPELADAEETLILDSSTYEGIGGLLWAPEFHEIEGKLYIFHAATPGEFFWEESHIMALKEGGNPARREDWSAPRRIVRKDGSDICEAGKEITLDMTCFLWEGDYYVVWSQRQFLPKDLGAWLYIAKLNPKEPWKLLTDPVVLSKPEYGWANNHTFVDEGPFALLRGDTLYLTFSSAAVDTSYVVGLLTIEKGKNLLNPADWTKKNYPILTSRSVQGEYGTGHNAYVIDEDGTVWNTYHARPGVDGVRSSGIRRVHFDFEGEPRLDVTEELDVLDALRDVEVTLVIS